MKTQDRFSGRRLWEIVILMDLLLVALMVLFFWRGSFLSADNGQQLFGASFPNLNNGFAHELASELDANVQARGHRLMVRDCGADPALQSAHIKQMVAQGARAVFICPVDEAALDDALALCERAGVAVVMVGDGQAGDGRCAVTSDNYSAGEQLAHLLAWYYTSARVLVISRAASAACADRTRGFASAIEGMAGFQVVGTVYAEDHIQGGIDAVERALSEGIAFDTIFSVNDGLGIGAYTALKRHGMQDDVRILSVDGGPDGKRMVQNGLFLATARQFPSLIAEQAAALAFSDGGGGAWRKEPVKLITRSTIASYDLDKWE